MSFDFDHAHKRREQIAKSITGSYNINNLEKSEEAHQDTVMRSPHENTARIAQNIAESYSNAPIEKSIIDELEKGGKRAFIGEVRTFSGREYIRTADGWKFHGKGTGKKAQEHKANAASHTKEATSAAKAAPKAKTFEEALADPEAKKLIEAIEHGSSDKELIASFKKELKEKHGYDYKSIDDVRGKLADEKEASHSKSVADRYKELSSDPDLTHGDITRSIKETHGVKTSAEILQHLAKHGVAKKGTVIAKITPEERAESTEKKSGKKEAHPEGTVREFGGRNYIKKDGKWKYHPKGASKPAEAKKEEAKPASGKHISDMSATEKKALADKLGVDVKGKTTKQVDKALSDAMVDKQMADWKNSKETPKAESAEEKTSAKKEVKPITNNDAKGTLSKLFSGMEITDADAHGDGQGFSGYVETGDRGQNPEYMFDDDEDDDGYQTMQAINTLKKPYEAKYNAKIKAAEQALKDQGYSKVNVRLNYGDKGHVGIAVYAKK